MIEEWQKLMSGNSICGVCFISSLDLIEFSPFLKAGKNFRQNYFYKIQKTNMTMNERRPIVGYTAGVFDLFHIGHLNLLKNAKAMCDVLIVGVTSDELVSYKHKKAVINFQERMNIVQSIKYVDTVVGQYDMDKFAAWERLKFDIMFVGDDWHRTEKWQTYEKAFNEVGVKIIYLPYTRGISSTIINKILEQERMIDEIEPSIINMSGFENQKKPIQS